MDIKNKNPFILTQLERKEKIIKRISDCKQGTQYSNYFFVNQIIGFCGDLIDIRDADILAQTKDFIKHLEALKNRVDNNK